MFFMERRSVESKVCFRKNNFLIGSDDLITCDCTYMCIVHQS